MAKNVRVSYLYATEDTWNKFEQIKELGWPQKTFLQQVCAAFLKSNQMFYGSAALIEANARGLAEDTAYRMILNDEQLPSYEKKPAPQDSPLCTTPKTVQDIDTTHRYNFITLSDYNSVLLKVACIVEDLSISQFVSILLREHMKKHWPTMYEPQFTLNDKCRFLVLED